MKNDNFEEAKNNQEKQESTFEGERPIVSIIMENGGEIKLELYPDQAENTVNNFIYLIEKGFYDGLIFHRVIEGFMIQGGDPDGTGMGGPDYGIKGEFKANGFDNQVKHTRGTISMARSQHPDSAGSQFFIVHKDAKHLDGQYAGFGRVIEGMDILDEIAQVKTASGDKPLEDQVMKELRVETFSYNFEEPKKE